MPTSDTPQESGPPASKKQFYIIAAAIKYCERVLGFVMDSMTPKSMFLICGGTLLILFNTLSIYSILSGSSYWLSALQFPYGMFDGEGGILGSVMDIHNGRSLYSSFGGPPYTVMNYPPIYFAFVAAINTLIPAPPLQLGRAVCMGAAVLSAVTCGAIVSSTIKTVGTRRTRIIASTTASLFFLGSYPVISWSAMMRVDLLALALSLGGLWAFAASLWRTGWLVFACTAFVLAGFTKPTTISALLACCGFASIIRPKIGLLMSAGCAVAAAIGVFVLDIVTKGEFYRQVIWANTLYPWDMTQATLLLSQFVFAYPGQVLVSAGVALAVVLAAFRVPTFSLLQHTVTKFRHLTALSAAYMSVSLILALTAGKVGADINYLLEVASAVAIMVGIAIAYGRQFISAIEKKQNLRLARYTVVGMSIAISSLGILQASAARGYIRDYERDRQRIRRDGPLFAASRDIIKMIAVLPGDVLTQDRSLAVLAGKRIFFEFGDASVAMDAGALDPTPLLNAIAARDFPAIVLYRNSYVSHNIMSAIAANYIPTDFRGPFVVYRPLVEPKSEGPDKPR